MGIASILFVCLGNICRSPLAEGIAKDLAAKQNLDLKIDSAGTSGWHINEPPCEKSILIAKQKGIDISHLRGRKINSYTDLDFDLVVAMDRQNLSDILRLGFPKEKVVLMGDFALQGQDIPDPYYYPNLEGFEKIYAMLENSIQELFKQKILT